MEKNPESAPTVTPHLTLQGHSTQKNRVPEIPKKFRHPSNYGQ